MVARFLIALAASQFVFISSAVAQSASQAAAQIPEGSHFTLFALGAAGVLIGRRLSMRKSNSDNDES